MENGISVGAAACRSQHATAGRVGYARACPRKPAKRAGGRPPTYLRVIGAAHQPLPQLPARSALPEPRDLPPCYRTPAVSGGRWRPHTDETRPGQGGRGHRRRPDRGRLLENSSPRQRPVGLPHTPAVLPAAVRAARAALDQPPNHTAESKRHGVRRPVGLAWPRISGGGTRDASPSRLARRVASGDERGTRPARPRNCPSAGPPWLFGSRLRDRTS